MKAPTFSLQEVRSDKTYSLSDYLGQPVMLTFWASWCLDCMKDLPQKEQFYEHADLEKLAFLTINVTGRERSEEAGKQFAIKNDLSFPVLKDEGRETYDQYGCSGVPTTVLLDKEHNIVETFGDQASFMDIVKVLPKIML